MPTLAENDAEVVHVTPALSAEGRKVIVVPGTVDGKQCYVEVEPLHDASLYTTYATKTVKNAEDQFLDVEIAGEWRRLSVQYEPLVVARV